MYDLVIIGGGVWGTAAALAAAEAGAGSILLVEKNDTLAAESSAKAGGIVSAFVSEDNDFTWVARSRELFLAVEAASGDTTMIRRSGMLTLLEPHEAHELDAAVAQLQRRHIPVEVREGAWATHQYPDLDRIPPDMVAVWTPEDWSVNPTAYAMVTAHQAQERGVTVHLGWRAAAIRIEETGVRIDGPEGPLWGRSVLVAAGTWTRKLVRTAGVDIALLPYRTQLASIEWAAPYRLPIVRQFATDRYYVPDGPRNLLGGDGTRLSEHDPDDYRTAGDPDFEEEIAAGLLQLTSRAEEAALRRSWAGLCGGTPDRRPLLGRVAEHLYVACGDNGFGIKRGPALGELAARVALGEPAPAEVDPLRHPPGPFTIRPGRGGSA